ncbi:formate/nitrite transporter family protein [Actinomyces wuliandei]|uniref:formate/nitrite transporter family protein n=1 Tax=Actinomyces wuliandei TaxID=2057743 RepID=UPI000FD82961|nr:formate/nitrite transporter family protein [Actinomyces wuliandei]
MADTLADTSSNPLFPGKQFISTVLEALDTKTRMTGTIAHRYLMRAAMAGMIVAVFYVVNYAVVGTFDELTVGGTSLAGVGRVLGALCFGPALVFIYYTRSELLTSNMMVVVIGGYYRRISWWRGLRVLGMCLLGNFLGGVVFALLYHFSSLLGGSTGDQAVHSVETKLAYLSSASGIGDLLVRAILCNFMINLAMLLIYNGFIHEDWSKIFSMIMAVFVFAFLGLEHSVANTVLFTVVGVTHGIEVPLALGNVAVALLGNFVGGGLLIGAYYAYANDDSRWLRRHAAAQPAAQAEGSQEPEATRS